MQWLVEVFVEQPDDKIGIVKMSIMSSKNVLCEICRQFAEKELELCAYSLYSRN